MNKTKILKLKSEVAKQSLEQTSGLKTEMTRAVNNFEVYIVDLGTSGGKYPGQTQPLKTRGNACISVHFKVNYFL